MTHSCVLWPPSSGASSTCVKITRPRPPPYLYYDTGREVEKYYPIDDLQDPKNSYQIILPRTSFQSQGCLRTPPPRYRHHGANLHRHEQKHHQYIWPLSKRWDAALPTRPSRACHEKFLLPCSIPWKVFLFAPPWGTLFLTHLLHLLRFPHF